MAFISLKLSLHFNTIQSCVFPWVSSTNQGVGRSSKGGGGIIANLGKSGGMTPCPPPDPKALQMIYRSASTHKTRIHTDSGVVIKSEVGKLYHVTGILLNKNREKSCIYSIS